MAVRSTRRAWLLRLLSAALAVPIAYFIAIWLPQFIEAPHLALNVRAKLFAERAAEVSRDVSIVRITDEAVAGMPYSVPLDRAYLSEVILAAAAYGPRMIMIDFVFDRPTEVEKDIHLIETLNSITAPMGIAFLESRSSGAGETGERARIELCASKLRAGAPHCDSFQDTFIARTTLLSPVPHARAYGFPTVVESRESGADTFVATYIPQSAPGGPCSLSDLAGHDTANFDCRHSPSRLIAWQLPPRGSSSLFHSVDSAALIGTPRAFPPLNCDPERSLTAKPKEMSAAEWLRTQQLYCRIIIIGGDFSFQDRHVTPISGALSGKHGRSGYVPGVEIQAQSIQQKLERRFWYEFSPSQTIAALFVCALVGASIRSFTFGVRETKFSIVLIFYYLVVLDVLMFVFPRQISPGLSIIIPSLAGGFACFVAAFLSFFIVEIGEQNHRRILRFLKEMLT